MTEITSTIIDAIGGDPTARASTSSLRNDLNAALARISALENANKVTITGTPPTTGQVGTAYSFTPTVAKGSGTKAFTLSSGTLLGGLSFNTATGAITGTPTVAGTMSGLVITVTDSSGSASTMATSVVISSVSSAAGDMTALRVRDATQMDPDSGSPAVGIDGNGWVAEVTIKGFTAPAANNTSDGYFACQKLELLVSDPGFRDSGGAIVATTVYRKIKGRALLRKQYKTASADVNGRFITQSGSDFVVLVALADRIYAGTTIVSAKVAAGFYTNGSNVSNASSASSLTNASTYAYKKPTAAWLNTQHLRATGDFPVEMIAFHRHAMGGRQVAGIKFQARDTTGNVSAEQTVTSLALSSMVKATGASKIEAFKATIPVSALTQGELCYTNAKVYPWIGDASAVYDLSVDGTNTGLVRVPDVSPHTRLRFFNDKAGTYGGVAYVDANASGTGAAVAATLATAKSTPYKTIVAAFAGLKAYHAARGHDDYAGGRIYLGNNTTSTIEYGAESNIPSPSTMGLTWHEIMLDPAATGTIYWTGKAPVVNVPSMTRIVGLLLKNTPGQFGNQTTFNDPDNATGYSMFSAESCTFETATTGQPMTGGTGILGYNIHYRTNCTSAQGGVLGVSNTGKIALALGNIQPNGPQPAGPQIGACNRSIVPSEGSVWSQTDGYFWVNNEWRYSEGPALLLYSKTRPTVIMGNLGECFGNGSTAIAFNMAADGTTMPVAELLDMHNTFIGNRGSRMYADTTEMRGVAKDGVSVGSVYSNYNFKTDSFDRTQNGSGYPGNTGNWPYGYQVGLRSNISLSGSLGGTVPNLQASYLGMAWEPDYSTYLVSTTFADVAALFVNYQALRNDQGTYPGGGDYHAASQTNALANRMPAVAAAFDAAFTSPINGAISSFDPDGKARRTDGTGAAGRYES